MPYNGAGSFTAIPPPDYPAVPNTLILASSFNAVVNDILAGLTNCVTRDGQSPPTANLPMAARRHTGVGNAVADSDYAAWGQTKAFANALNGRLLAVQRFIGAGSYTYTPTAGADFLIIMMVGGGGGGGSAGACPVNNLAIGSGGGSGAYGLFYTTTVSTQTVVVGTGGTGGTAGSNNATYGTSSTFGTLASAQGGLPGETAGPSPIIFTAASLTYPVPPVASGPNVLATSSSVGAPGIASQNEAIGGAGGSNPMGAGGYPTTAVTTSVPGHSPGLYGYGGGGGGACNRNVTGGTISGANGGDGARGAVIVLEFGHA